MITMNALSPSFLYEVFESDSDDEGDVIEDEEIKTKTARCFLCGVLQECQYELSEELEDSGNTISDVLSKLFSRKQIPACLARKDTSQGLLCTFCKYLVMDLIRLQKELKTVESIIVRTFKNSEDTDERSGSSDKQGAYSRIETDRNESIKIYRVEENKYSLGSNHRRHKRKRKNDKRANYEKEENNVDKQQKTNAMRKSLKRKISEGGENNKTSKDCVEKTDNNHNKEYNKQSLRKNEVETVLENSNGLYESDDAPKEDEAVYNIEALIANNDGEYLVKWENYPDSENTWEPASCIPDTIIEVSTIRSNINTDIQCYKITL